MKNKYINSLLGENEKMLLVTRQHWFVLFGTILAEVIIIIALLAALITATVFYPIAAIGFVVLLIPIGSMVRDILVWYNRQYIVSNRRVMQVNGIINKNVIDSSLEKVNDVKMSQSFFGRIFDYGNVEIMTASELGVNVFQRIGDPVHFKTAMLNAKEKLGYDEMGYHPQPGQDIPGMITKLDELRKQGILTEEEFNQKKANLLAKL
jgi:membrane protein YdbS with pleckstrin-like domain